MKSKLRLRFVLPLAVIAVGGLAVFQLGLLDRLTGSDDEASAAGPAVTETAPTGDGSTTGTGDGQTEPADGQAATADGEDSAASKPTGMEQLEKKLAKKDVVVLVVYTPDSGVDTRQISEAREGADRAKAGFLALNGLQDSQVAEIAELYDVRATPTVLVFTGGPELVTKIDGYADATTVEQAATNAPYTG